MNEQPYLVVLTANCIQVTASSLNQATRYAREDALEFRRDWNYTTRSVAPGAPGCEVTSHLAEVFCTEQASPRQRDGIWTFDAHFECYVPTAVSASDAERAARELIQQP